MVIRRPSRPSGFHDWEEVCPELAILRDNWERIAQECARVSTGKQFSPWPQKHMYWTTTAWTVYGFCGFGQVSAQHIQECPVTAGLLAKVPGVQSALFSRLEAGQEIEEHTGPPELSNFILRCHLGLDVPPKCGLTVRGETRSFGNGEMVVFDDAITHSAFNDSNRDRFILIVDIPRPEHMPRPHPEIASQPQWGISAPTAPPGWEDALKNGDFRHAPSYAEGYETLLSENS